MPIYEYECGHCGVRFERLQKFTDPPLSACPECGSEEVRRLITPPGIVFKGSGWYITDSRPKSSSTSAESKPTDATTEKTTASSTTPSDDSD